MNPFESVPPPAGRPEHRLHPVHGRLLRAPLRAPEPELRDRHPGRAARIILAFIGFGSLPLNVGGLLLLGLAIVLFVLELTVTSHGLLAIGGLVCLRAGRVRALHGRRQPHRAGRRGGACRSSWPWSPRPAAFMLVIVAAALRSRRMRHVAGHGSARRLLAAGAVGEVRTPARCRVGTVYVGGEEWSARSRGRAAAAARHARARRPPGWPDARRRTRRSPAAVDPPSAKGSHMDAFDRGSRSARPSSLVIVVICPRT